MRLIWRTTVAGLPHSTEPARKARCRAGTEGSRSGHRARKTISATRATITAARKPNTHPSQGDLGTASSTMTRKNPRSSVRPARAARLCL